MIVRQRAPRNAFATNMTLENCALFVLFCEAWGVDMFDNPDQSLAQYAKDAGPDYALLRYAETPAPVYEIPIPKPCPLFYNGYTENRAQLRVVNGNRPPKPPPAPNSAPSGGKGAGGGKSGFSLFTAKPATGGNGGAKLLEHDYPKYF